VVPPDLPVLISAQQLALRVAEMGQELHRDLANQQPILIGVLKGAFVFMADLVRSMSLDMTCDFLRVSSYGAGVVSSGEVRLELDTTQPIAGNHVVLVEDIVDTGLTLHHLCEQLRSRHPASLKVVALLHKPSRQKISVQLDYIGFEIDDHFVVGYGLDYAGRFRNLPYVAILPASELTPCKGD
jgi:hypoxanthine phosphoribosyltransferase